MQLYITLPRFHTETLSGRPMCLNCWRCQPLHRKSILNNLHLPRCDSVEWFSYANFSSGLCGNSNNDTTDDFTSSNNIRESSSKPFALSWGYDLTGNPQCIGENIADLCVSSANGNNQLFQPLAETLDHIIKENFKRHYTNCHHPALLKNWLVSANNYIDFWFILLQKYMQNTGVLGWIMRCLPTAITTSHPINIKQ